MGREEKPPRASFLFRLISKPFRFSPTGEAATSWPAPQRPWKIRSQRASAWRMGGDGPPFPSQRDGQALKLASQGAATGRRRRLLIRILAKKGEPRPSTSSCTATERPAQAWFERRRITVRQIVLNTFTVRL